MKKLCRTNVFWTLTALLLLAWFPANSEIISPHPASQVETGYFGETVTHPGVTVSLGMNLFSNEWYSISPKIKMGWYIHRRNHHGLQLSAGLLQKAYLPGGLGMELESLVGLLNTIPDGEVLQYDDQGDLVQDAALWNPKLMISASWGIHYSLMAASSIPVEPFIRVGAFLEYPFNSLWLPHAVVETGVRVGRY